MRNGLLAELVAEFVGTMIILLFGAGVVSMVVLFGTGTPGEVVSGGYTNITLAWGLGVTFGVFVAGKISGAHLNPAVTLDPPVKPLSELQPPTVGITDLDGDTVIDLMTEAGFL